ncbi:MAG: efflux RND transporter permease subunit, partial [Aeoliella sp.]
MDIVGRLVRWHREILLVATLLALASVASLWRPGLSEDFSLKTLAGSNSEQFQQLEAYIEQFAGVELTLIVVRSDAVLSPTTQACLTKIVERAQELPAVSGAACISQAPTFVRAVMAHSRVVRGLLVSEDGKAAAVLLQMSEDTKATPRSETVAALKRIVADAASLPGHQVVLTGPYVVSYEMTRLVWTDLVTFGLLGAVAALLVLSLSFGSFRLAFFPLLVGLATVALVLGLSMVLLINTALNLPMLVLLSAVLTMANCVHLAVGHDEERGDATATVRRLLRPCTGVVATTIVGFAAVGVSALQPVRSFSLLMGLGLAIGLLLSLAAACGTLKQTHSQAILSAPIAWLLRAALRWVRRFPRSIVAGFAVVGVAAACLITQLEFNLRFLDNFRPTDEIRQNYEFVQDTLAPMQTIEVLVNRSDGKSPLTPKSVQAISQLSEKYDQEFPIARAVSIVDFLTFAGAKLPESSNALQRRIRFIQSSLRMVLGEDPLAMFVGEETKTLRVSFLAYEGPSAADKIALGDQLHNEAQELLGEEYEVEVTGLYYFYAHVARSLLRDQAISLAVSIVGVFLTMTVVLRSWRFAAVGMAPPLFAGATCVGLMALFRVPFNTVTSMMLAVALGIAVDDTIHYLWRYKVKRRQGHTAARAIVATQLTVGRACTLTSLVIAAGFAVMGFSRFLPIAYFGCVISAVMAIALAANIV